MVGPVGVAVAVRVHCRRAVALALLAVLAHGYANCPSPQGRLYTDTQGNAACFQDYDSGSTSIHPCFVNSDACMCQHLRVCTLERALSTGSPAAPARQGLLVTCLHRNATHCGACGLNAVLRSLLSLLLTGKSRTADFMSPRFALTYTECK